MAAPEAIIAELGDVAEELRARHPGVMRALQAAYAKAQKDRSYVPRYKALIEQSIARVRAHRSDVLSTDALEAAIRDFYNWYDHEAVARNISEIEQRRGMLSHQSWMEKWFPDEWAKFVRAHERVVEAGTQTAVNALRPAAVALMDAYVGDSGARAESGVRYQDR